MIPSKCLFLAITSWCNRLSSCLKHLACVDCNHGNPQNITYGVSDQSRREGWPVKSHFLLDNISTEEGLSTGTPEKQLPIHKHQDQFHHFPKQNFSIVIDIYQVNEKWIKTP